MYVVEFLFDENSEKKINKLWKELINNNINPKLSKMKGLRPHITIAVYDELDEESFLRDLKKYKKTFKSININFDIVGSFPSTGTCFIKPTVTMRLLEEHKRFHEFFEKHNNYVSKYYIVDNWNPHCTLGLKLKNSEISNIFNYTISNFTSFEAKLVDIAFIKIDFKDEENSESFRII